MTTPSEFQSDHQHFGNKKGLLIVAVAAIVAVVLWQTLPFDAQANKGLALLFFVAVLWLTEAIHTTLTALMIPFLAVLLGMPDMDARAALASFANPIIFLFFGGFALAAALQIQQLDRKIALQLIRLSGGRLNIAIYMVFAATAFLSMWISNTATTAMMLPLVVGMLAQIDRQKERNTFVFALLGLAYSAAVGGIGTLVGTPPNAITAKALDLDFAAWMKVGVPFMLLLFPVMLLALHLVFRPQLKRKMAVVQDDIAWTPKRLLTLAVFALTALGWIFSSQLNQIVNIKDLDSIIALFAAIAVGALGLAKWQEISDNTDWGILMLFGGGITLSVVLQKSGAALVLGQGLANLLQNAPFLVVIAVVAAFIVILTEFSSNTASAALLVPVFASVAAQMGMPQATLVMTIGLGVSLAFMMPVATPPNAIVMGSGLIRQREMMKGGALLNLMGVGLLTVFVYFMWG